MGTNTKARNTWELGKWPYSDEVGNCWSKKFGRGRVYVCCGDEHLVCYSYGANANESCSGTRWNYGEIISEQDMMSHIDASKGLYQPYPLKPGQYRAWFETLNQEQQDAIRAVGQPFHRMVETRHLQLMAI